MTQPISPTELDELRRLMHLDWADGAVDGAPPLADTDRAANLYGVVADPYHRLAFGSLSRARLLLICIHNLMENHQWDKASRAIARLDRMERDQERERERERVRRQPLTGNIEPAAPAKAAPIAPTASVKPPPEPPTSAAPTPLPRAVMQAMSTAQLFEFCAGQLSLTPAEFHRKLETSAPFT